MIEIAAILAFLLPPFLLATRHRRLQMSLAAIILRWLAARLIAASCGIEAFASAYRFERDNEAYSLGLSFRPRQQGTSSLAGAAGNRSSSILATSGDASHDSPHPVEVLV